MRSDAFVTVTCDVCKESEEDIQLTATAHGYDMRHVDSSLKALGWRVDGSRDICPECDEDEGDHASDGKG